jgi:2-oxo-4-hydroxy-4-carboxy--5-ureidoimidazoline (OHCU) decarboxylase
MLTFLGLRNHPPLKVLLEIAASSDAERRAAALDYLTSNFNNFYRDEYNPGAIKIPFVPCADGDDVRAIPSECFITLALG